MNSSLIIGEWLVTSFEIKGALITVDSFAQFTFLEGGRLIVFRKVDEQLILDKQLDIWEKHGNKLILTNNNRIVWQVLTITLSCLILINKENTLRFNCKRLRK
jgi:hypothetical protein